MKTKQELLDGLEHSATLTQNFVDDSMGYGGMGVEARIKLLEHQVQDLYWFIHKLSEHVPEAGQYLEKSEIPNYHNCPLNT